MTQLGRSATTSAGRSESTRFGWHVAHSSGYVCWDSGPKIPVVDLLIGWGADVLQRDCGGDSAFSLAPSGKCVAACMDQSWKQLTILDVLLRYLEGLTALTCCAALLRTCKTWASRVASSSRITCATQKVAVSMSLMQTYCLNLHYLPLRLLRCRSSFLRTQLIGTGGSVNSKDCVATTWYCWRTCQSFGFAFRPRSWTYRRQIGVLVCCWIPNHSRSERHRGGSIMTAKRR